MHELSLPGEMLQLEVQAEDGTVVIRCAGELDMSVCDKLCEAIAWSYTRELKALRLDMTALTFMDSSGLACLVETNNRCQHLGVRFDLIPSEPVARLLDLTGAPIPHTTPARPTLGRTAR